GRGRPRSGSAAAPGVRVSGARRGSAGPRAARSLCRPRAPPGHRAAGLRARRNAFARADHRRHGRGRAPGGPAGPVMTAIRILLYSHYFAPSIGGVEAAFLSLARGLAEGLDGQAPFAVTVATKTEAGGLDDSAYPFQ